MQYFNYNGRLFSHKEKVISPTDRGFRYGDGLFETMKFTNGNLVLADEHFARLWKGMQLFQIAIPKLWSPENFAENAAHLAMKNKLGVARIRLTVFRGAGGISDGAGDAPSYIIEALPLTDHKSSLNENGLQLCIYRDALKSIDAFSSLKHNNCLPYFMGALYAKQQQCNDAVILNNKGNICETTIANLFLLRNGEIYTPSLAEGCIAGVMRKFVLDRLRELHYAVHETMLTVEDLLRADEVFLTNSIYNIRWVAAVETKSFTKEAVQKIAQFLQSQCGEVFA